MMTAIIISIVHKHVMQTMSILAGAMRIRGLIARCIASRGDLQKGQLGLGVVLSLMEHKAHTRCLQHLNSYVGRPSSTQIKQAMEEVVAQKKKGPLNIANLCSFETFTESFGYSLARNGVA